jgi:predicted alpha/beta-fold hydrolase
MCVRIIQFVLYSLLECVVGLLLWPFNADLIAETAQVTCMDTAKNILILHAMNDLLARFQPAPWAVRGVAQTLFASYNPNARYPYSRVESVVMSDSVHVLVHWKELNNLNDAAPIVFLCPGIAGCSNSRTVKTISDVMADHGWRSVVYTRRGHGQSSLLPTEHLSACKGFPVHCDVDDMADVVKHVRMQFPNAPMLLVGFSAGANLAVKYLGTRAAESPFMCAVSVCNGHKLVPLTHDFIERPMANAIMTNALQGLLAARLAEMKQIALAKTLHLDFDKLRKTVNVREFEEMLMLPLNQQFNTLDDYYTANSCGDHMKDIRVPLLCMATSDDPLIGAELANHAVIASKTNPNIICVQTKRGGHLGWLSGWRGKWWMMDVIERFLLTANTTPY